MEQFNSIFEYWAQYHVIYCRNCRYCVVTSQCLTRLNRHHSQIPPRTRKRIVGAIDSLPDVAHEVQDVIYPSSQTKAVDGLPVHKNAFQCLGSMNGGRPCPEIRTTICSIQEHCKSAHGWENEQKRGGNAKQKQTQSANRLWRSGVYCQRFFLFPEWTRYFEVQKETDKMNLERADELVKRGEAMLAAQLQELEQHQRTQKVQADENRYEANAWLDRAGWAISLDFVKYKRL